MIKRASTILITLFLLLLGINTTFAAPSCQTTFSKTNFAPKTTGATYYDLDGITFSEGIPTDINSPLDFVENANPGRGKYTVSGNKLSIGCVKEGNLLAINIPNLKPGKVYSISITGNVRLRAKEGDASEKHRTKFKLAAGNSNKYFENNKSDWSATGKCNMSLEFTASSDYVAATISTDYSGDCYILDITEIKIIGCFDPTVTSANGYELCKGEENTYTAIGINGPLKWEYSTDNKATWKKLTDKTGNSVTADLQDDFFYVRASNGTNKVESNKIQTFICCSKTSANKDKHIVVYEEYFNLKSGQRRELDNNARSQYPYSAYGPIGGDQSISGEKAEYAIVHKASDGGYWKSEPVRQGNTVEKPGESDSNDGFLLVNCGKEKQDFFYYLVKQGNLCAESLYDFSVDITNVDNTAGQAPVNASILVYGQQNGTLSSTPLLEIETGNLESGHDWETFTRSFNSGGYKEFRISVRNNYQGTESDVKGNDIGIDNIVFRTCAPEIQIFAPKEDGSLEYEEVVLECNRKIKLEAIATYDLTEFFSTPQYLFQISTDKVNWTNVGSVQTTPSVEITVDDTYLNGFYYQVWVGADAAEVLKSGRTQTQGTGCGALTAVSDPINVKYECTNSSLPPTLKDFSSCALEDGKYDLYNTITKINLSDGTSEDVSNLDLAAKKAKIATLGKIEWYKEGETTALPSSVIDFPTSPDNPGIYYAKFKQLDTSTIYTQSGPASVKISLKKTIEVTVSPEEIEGCLSEISKDPAGRTFYVTKVNPVASPATDYTYTWKNVKADGTEDATPLKSGDENFYALPSEAGSGTIKLYVESKTTAACPSVAKELTYNIADNPNFDCSISVPCNSQLSTTGIVINLTNISGSTALTIKRDGTEIKSETLTAGSTTYTYTDTNVAATATSVKYEVILGAGSCSKEFKETYNISAVNQFSLTSNATDIKESDKEIEYHICEGTESTTNTVTVTAGYELKPGELFEWYVNDVKDEAADGNDKNYTLTGLTEETKFKAVIVAEVGAVTCGGEAEITIYVDKKPIVTVEDKTICLGESTSFTASNVNYDSYQWTPTDFLSNPDKATTSVNKPTGNKTYSLKVVDGVCSTLVEDIKLTVNPLPTINNVDVQTKDNGERNITIIADGEDPLTYSLDNVNFDGPEEIINKVSIGWNLLYLKDGYGCKDTLAFKIDPIEIIPDKYFTPNGDNNHEEWTVKNLNTYDSYIVEIFDRYGKRLFVQRVGSFSSTGKSDVTGDEFKGWDGIYNGHPMPSDDYWYLITLEDVRKQYTGHFTLKR